MRRVKVYLQGIHSRKMKTCKWLTWQSFYGLIRGMQGVDGGSLVLKGYPRTVRVLITVNQDLVTVFCLDEGPSLGVDIDVNESLDAPLVGFTIETWDQTHPGGVLLIQVLRALCEAALRDWTVQWQKENQSILGTMCKMCKQHLVVTFPLIYAAE